MVFVVGLIEVSTGATVDWACCVDCWTGMTDDCWLDELSLLLLSWTEPTLAEDIPVKKTPYVP